MHTRVAVRVSARISAPPAIALSNAIFSYIKTEEPFGETRTRSCQCLRGFHQHLKMKHDCYCLH